MKTESAAKAVINVDLSRIAILFLLLSVLIMAGVVAGLEAKISHLQYRVRLLEGENFYDQLHYWENYCEGKPIWESKEESRTTRSAGENTCHAHYASFKSSKTR